MSETFEQWFEKRMTSPDEWGQAKTYYWLKDCWHARDAEIQALRDHLANVSKEIERLKRPEMVRELPTVGGRYFYRMIDPPSYAANVDRWTVPVIVASDSREVLFVFRLDRSGVTLLDDMPPGYWSAKPIEPDPMPEGGE